MLLQKITLSIFRACLLIFSAQYCLGLDYVMIDIMDLSQDNWVDNCSTEAESDVLTTEQPSTVRAVGDSVPTAPYNIRSSNNSTEEPPLDQLPTGPTTDQQTEDAATHPPTLPETASRTQTDPETATSSTAKETASHCSQVAAFEDMDVCLKVINITWISTPPFIFQAKNARKQPTRDNADLVGVFYNIIARAVQFCCKYNDPYQRGTRLQYTHRAWNRSMLHANIFHGEASVGLPVYIENEFFDLSYAGSLSFIKVLESPGLILIANKNNVKESGKQVVWKAIANEWPVVFISLLLCAISGICIWALDTAWNSDEFPRHFHRGAFEGFWWAFVTMSTVGYGDKAPRSMIARLFCIVWIMVGLTVCSVMTATLTTALASAASRDVELVGKKIAVLKRGPAYQEVIKHGGNPTEFDTFDEMHKALVQTKTATGILTEMYGGLYWMEQIGDSRLYVARVLKRIRSYGFAFKHHEIFAWPAEDCIRNLILHRREDVYSLMKDYMDAIEENLADALGEDDVVILGGNSPEFRSIVFYLSVFLGALIGAVLLCELAMFLYRRIQRKNRTEDSEGGEDNANCGANNQSISDQEMRF